MKAEIMLLTGAAADAAADAISDALHTAVIEPRRRQRIQQNPGAVDRAAEDALYSAWALEHLLARARQAGRVAIAVTDGAIDTGFGVNAMVVYAPQKLQCTEGHGHGQIAGAAFCNWHHVLLPVRSWPAPDWACDQDVPVPATVEQMLEEFAAATTPSPATATHTRPELVVHRDVVVPPEYGSSAHTMVVPHGVQVRALAGCAGHNKFTRPR